MRSRKKTSWDGLENKKIAITIKPVVVAQWSTCSPSTPTIRVHKGGTISDVNSVKFVANVNTGI